MSNALGQFEKLPRARLAHTPTPIEELANLTTDLGGATLHVKRDDCTGLAFGGNKIRQLEYYVGDALAKGADTLLITGAVQSNFVRSTAAFAAKLGLKCHVQLEERVRDPGETYRASGNVLLDQLLGATIHHYPAGEDEAGADRRLGEIAGELEAAGARPYIIPLSPGHPPLGALGYVAMARELLDQLDQTNLAIDRIFVASGSGATHGGLLYGLRAFGSDIPVTGVCVRRGSELQRPRMIARMTEIAELLSAASPVHADDVITDDSALAPGYGTLNEAVRSALRLAAQREALFVDPVYTGRTLAAMLAAAREATADKRYLFVHTGGQPALFAYQSELAHIATAS